MIVLGIDETNKGIEADEVNMRGRGRVFAGLSNGRSFVMKVWFLYQAHIDNGLCRCPNLFGEDGHHAESLRELAR